MPPKRAIALPVRHDEVLHCPLCISELDSTERTWAPCPCGYQLCLFCYDRIKSEFSGQCPGCRKPYDADFQVSLVEHKAAAAHAREAASPTFSGGSSGGASERGSGGGGEAGGGGGGHHAPPAAGGAAIAGSARAAPPASPGRDLHIDEEQFWPSLASTATKSATPATTAATSRHTSPRESPSPPPVATHHAGGGGGAPDGLQHETSSTSSSATTATTPQSPACSVVAYRARTASSVVEMLQGTCHVSLAPSVLAPPPLDEEGAALAASLQEAVRTGSLSVKQAAGSIVSYLRQKHLAAVGPSATAVAAAEQLQQLQLRHTEAQLAAAPSGGLAADAGRSGAAFSSGLFGGGQAPGAAPSLLDSTPSIAASEAPTLAAWGRTDSLATPMSSLTSPLAAASGGSFSLFEGWSASPQQSPTQQLPQQPPARNGRLPLYARGAASAQAAAGFPGFPPSPMAHKQPLSPPGFSRSLGYGPSGQQRQLQL